MTTIVIPARPKNCPDCGQEYVYHQHPMKPLGVCSHITCGCVFKVVSNPFEIPPLTTPMIISVITDTSKPGH
jgi:hypothetical protein